MGSPRFVWVIVAVLPTVVPPSVMAQTASGLRSSELGRGVPQADKLGEPAQRKPARRGRSRTSQAPEDRWATNDWNPHYLIGKSYYIHGRYERALTELAKNLADCEQIDFEAMRRQNGYFEHIWSNISGLGESPHQFIRASNLQWVGATLAAQGNYDRAEERFGEMANYAEKCFPGKLSTFAGCAGQGLAFLLAARGQYAPAAERYRVALAHVEGNQSQYGLPPAPCVAMILVALADVELARGHASAAEQCLRRADHVQEAQSQLGFGPAPLDRAALLTLWAQLRYHQKRDSEAYDLYAQALELIRDVRKDHPLTAYCLDGLGEIDLARGRLGQSEGHFRESLAVRRAALGESHRELAYSLGGLARGTAAQGKRDQAESLSKEARAILSRALGLEHPDVAALDAPLKRDAVAPGAGDKPARPRARFLAIPTLLAVGWQVLHVGKDWRAIEAKIRYRELKEAKTSHHATMTSHAATSAGNGR